MRWFERANKNNWIKKAEQEKKGELRAEEQRLKKEKRAREDKINKEEEEKQIIKTRLSKFIPLFENYQAQLKQEGYIDSNEDLEIIFDFIGSPHTHFNMGLRNVFHFGPQYGSYGMEVRLSKDTHPNNINFKLHLITETYSNPKKSLVIAIYSWRANGLNTSSETSLKKFVEKELSEYIKFRVSRKS